MPEDVEMPGRIWPGSCMAARRGAQTRRQADRRSRAAPGDEAKIEEAVRRLRSAEVLRLNVYGYGYNLGGRAQGVDWLRISSSHAKCIQIQIDEGFRSPGGLFPFRTSKKCLGAVLALLQKRSFFWTQRTYQRL